LDAVEGCAFECSYCSVRSFYDDHRIGIDDKFVENLSRVEIDPDRPYHIGTGQSSDSLMWGNRGGVLGALLDFAREHPRVILELKTKSDNVAYLLERDIPANLICTWSLNTRTIVENEEHGTAPVENRVEAAKKLAARGNLVGFHFHPIVEYDGYRRDYPELYRRVTDAFHPDDVALVSFGTLTFIKPVIRSLRERRPASKILQMPLEPAGGKYSYPLERKETMFREAYEAFAPWHGKVFFYLCMEDAALWPAVFGTDFEDNDAFERAMIGSYEEKIREKRLSHR
jgi:spore photoproduct lyase